MRIHLKYLHFVKRQQRLESDDRSLSEIEDFTKIPGIGKGTAAVIQEYIEWGTSEVLQELEKKYQVAYCRY